MQLFDSPWLICYDLAVRRMQVNAVHAARGKHAPMVDPQHLVFSVGLMDYLRDQHFIEVWLWPAISFSVAITDL